MAVNEVVIESSLEQLRQESSSDFAAIGVIDIENRKLCWHYARGSVSARTLLIVQKTSSGLTGTAIRSGRPAKSNITATESERFKLGEPLVLTERLDAAVSLPLYYSDEVAGIVLLGRRSQQNYSVNELDAASSGADELVGLLFEK